MAEQANKVVAFVTLEPETCYQCGIAFGISSNLHAYLLKNRGTTFYCPAGHAQHYIGKTEEQKLREELERERQQSKWNRDRADRIDRSRRAIRGQVTKIKKRVGNGVCPCCNRTFQNLLRHMHTKHPKYKERTEN